MADQIRVQVLFTEEVDINGNVIPFTDALYFTPEEYEQKTQEEIQSLKQERIDNFVEAVINPVEGE